MRRISLLLFCILFATVRPLSGQEATLIGVVADSLSGDSLAGAFVSIVGHDRTVLTGMNGRFALAGVGSGDMTIEVRRPGFRPGTVSFEITVSRAVTVDLGTVVLSPLVIEMDPIVVEATEVENKLNRVGFFQRMSTEQGTFLTLEDIERRNPRNTSELVRRIPGFQVGTNGSISSRRGVPGMSQGFSACEIEYYIDGVHADGSRVDDVLPAAVVAMEVYTGAATIPPAFRLSGNARCGVVVIWTRTGGTPRPGG